MFLVVPQDVNSNKIVHVLQEISFISEDVFIFLSFAVHDNDQLMGGTGRFMHPQGGSLYFFKCRRKTGFNQEHQLI